MICESMANLQRPLSEMRDYIRSFRLDNLRHGDQGYGRVLLQLVGLVGYGKSALVNSCKCVLDDGEFIMYAKATDSTSADTTCRTAYELTPSLSLVDNRPVIHLDGEEAAEMYAQLGNFRPLNEPVNKWWTYSEFMSILEDTEWDPNYTDLVVPVFVYHAGHMLIFERDYIHNFLKHCKLMTGIIPTVVITNKAKQTSSELESNFKAMGVEQVIWVENYTTANRERSRGKDTDILTFLYNALQDVTFHLSHQRDLRRERVERKKFLLNYIHNVEVERKIAEANRARKH